MLNLMELAEGQKVRLRNGSVGEVIENIGDGIWVQLRFVTSVHGGAAEGDEELVHCEEIAGLQQDE